MRYRWLWLGLTLTLLITIIIQHCLGITAHDKYVHNALKMRALKCYPSDRVIHMNIDSLIKIF